MRDLLPALLLAIYFSLVVDPSVLAAQEHTASAEIAERCRSHEYRQFDFWLGEWAVRNANDELIGHNEITRIGRGCGLAENWRGTAGGQGVSVNTYDSGTKTWTQRWVGDGATLWLEGGLRDGSMVLTGTAPRATPNGAVLDRISWTPLPDGRVVQLWEISSDEGTSWRPLFRGFYERVRPGATTGLTLDIRQIYKSIT